ncbi:MAG TPA: two-component regulator propeller domain-containing protein, partial [Chitinophagaceae bacterium]|nr:two-component regulator propeller domain-containing protein [Chitinophagaceae bacterium]
DGLVADRITVITQDQDGFMWLGSLFGLSRYDGTRFTTIDLPAEQRYKYVTSLLAADNKVFAGFLFDGGLMEYEKGRTTAHFIHPYQRGSGNDIVCLADDAQGILVANSLNVVYRFAGSKFQRLFTSSEDIISMASDDEGRIWIATNSGLQLFDKGKLSNVVKGAVLCLRQAGKGVMVVWSNGVNTRLGFASDAFHIATKWQTSAVAQIQFQGANPGTYWGIDYEHGLFNKDPTGRMEYYTSTLHPATEIKYLFADRENNLWMVTDPGVLKISNIPAISYQFEELAPGGSDICQGNDSTIWCTNSKFLYRIINNKLQKVEEFRSGTEKNYIGALIMDNSNYLWASSWNNGL